MCVCVCVHARAPLVSMDKILCFTIIKKNLFRNTSQLLSAFLNRKATRDPTLCKPALTCLRCDWLQQRSTPHNLKHAGSFSPTLPRQAGRVRWRPGLGIAHVATPPKSSCCVACGCCVSPACGGLDLHRLCPDVTSSILASPIVSRSHQMHSEVTGCIPTSPAVS